MAAVWLRACEGCFGGHLRRIAGCMPFIHVQRRSSSDRQYVKVVDHRPRRREIAHVAALCSHTETRQLRDVKPFIRMAHFPTSVAHISVLPRERSNTDAGHMPADRLFRRFSLKSHSSPVVHHISCSKPKRVLGSVVLACPGGMPDSCSKLAPRIVLFADKADSTPARSTQ